ncbi:MAG: DUF58 domain-containing protein [Verrucomicrobia bacterium]|nr:DUF58 domain-containing protein [Verrucomicrobiota bacterium]
MSTKPVSYLNPEVLDRIKRLEIRARMVVEGFITGMHRSPYNGFAIEFAGHREYAPGDELKHIDWKVWSKTDRLYIKEYEEETNLKCTLIIDASKSMAYGAPKWSKFDYAATAAAALAHLLQQQQDAVGLVTFNNKIKDVLPASSRSNHLRQMVHTLEQLEPSDATDVSDVFVSLAGQIRRRGIVAIFSDLMVDEKTLKDALQQFRLRKHDVILFHIMHDDELTFPFDENTRFIGLEDVEDEIEADPRALHQAYLNEVEQFLKATQKTCASIGVDYRLVNTKLPLDAVLSEYLNFRKSKSRKS